MSEDYAAGKPEGPWNPGIQSRMTRDLLALSMIFRPENVFGDLKGALEVQEVAGLALDEVTTFRSERLALHEILVRITGDFEVPDRDNASVPSLGIRFRHMVHVVLARGIEPNLSDLERAYQEARLAADRVIEHTLALSFSREPPAPTLSPRRWRWRPTSPRPPAMASGPDLDWDSEASILAPITSTRTAELWLRSRTSHSLETACEVFRT
jgi:hypothetical protein